MYHYLFYVTPTRLAILINFPLICEFKAPPHKIFWLRHCNVGRRAIVGNGNTGDEEERTLSLVHVLPRQSFLSNIYYHIANHLF